MSSTVYKYTELKIRMVEVDFENWEDSEHSKRVYFEIVDDNGNIYMTFDNLG